MSMARHWRLRGCRPRSALSALSSLGSRGGQNVSDRSYCSLEESGNSQPLNLANLGFKNEQDVELELSRAPLREGGRRPQRSILEKSPRIPPSAAPPAPSEEDMKRAALDASYILARIAGMQLRRPKNRAAVEVDVKSARKAENLQPQEEEGFKEEEQDTFIGVKESAEALALNHPWPEWLEFLRDLQTKGFFEGTEDGVDEGKHMFESSAAVRHAINAFGRSHSEIFNCLTRKDLRVLANFGCPSVDRKASNASKRLRAHFHIPEGDVCQRCRLKMTCPRAYFAPESKLSMNTLDVVRIIAGFATNVWPNVDSYESYPMEVGTSICNLLREFLMYKILPKNLAEKEHALTERLPLESETNVRKQVKSSPPVDPKPGDWTCPNCEFLNFNRNRRCRECRVCRPQREKNAYIGDWHCPKCRYLNFSKNSVCRECQFERQTTVKWMGGERLPDDHSSSVKPASVTVKLPNKERNYEASDEEEVSDMCSMDPDKADEPESDATFSEEEGRTLSRGLANVARRLTRPTFKWEEVKEEVEGLFDLRVTNKSSKVSQRTSKQLLI
ncbi:hypothetical protein GOP47_0006572 [Adiantum capillus-veneris]|uniref:RanBP2-type domain-containing protein n=1 Tax=Adiantum capillus-veneris TaxID=13818 RepID=A0A9D4V349_ADICA|nr:hypothetical protein GOP47_0006572 [Adiantum capillus-veneris]